MISCINHFLQNLQIDVSLALGISNSQSAHFQKLDAPKLNWVKLNMDGAMAENPMCLACTTLYSTYTCGIQSLDVKFSLFQSLDQNLLTGKKKIKTLKYL